LDFEFPFRAGAAHAESLERKLKTRNPKLKSRGPPRSNGPAFEFRVWSFEFPFRAGGFACASPLIHDGLAYVVDAMGSLFVIDLKEKKVVYRRELGTGFELRSVVHVMGTAYASPVLAGKHIYIFGMDGTTVVLKPGRTCEEVARNKIEDVVARNYGVWPEGFASTPVAESKFLYIRGDKYLYCIGEKRP
jgi:hypothetical protein